MRVFDVFTPGLTPTVTFVDGHLQGRKQAFEDALAQGGMLINISGPSKSGKTVFVKTVVGDDNLLAISGAGVTSADDLWLRVFHLIGTPVENAAGNEQGTTVTIGGSAKASGSVFVAKAEAALSASGAMVTKQTTTAKAAVDYLQLLIKELQKSEFVLFIDDFHYIPRDVQNEVAQQVKEAIHNGVKVACASVPHHSEDVLRANSDLRGRIIHIDFDYWQPDVLRKIPELGFASMNVSVAESTLNSLVSEVAGSPQLMQSICLNACLEAGARTKQAAPLRLPESSDFYTNVCTRTAATADYSSTYEKLRDGPKTRGTDRKQYRLNDGTVGDVYTILLQAIALEPPTLHFRYAELVDRIKTVCEGETPVGSSVTGACLHISQLANDGHDRAIVAWDSAEDILDIRDPYLLFYIRWNEAENN